MFVFVELLAGGLIDVSAFGGPIFVPYPVILIAYFTRAHGGLGQAPGKWLLRIRVVSESTGGRTGYPRALVRSLTTAALWILIIPGPIDGLRRLPHNRHQTWRDGVREAW